MDVGAEFLVVGHNQFWAAARLLATLVAMANLMLIARCTASPLDGFTKWVFLGLAGFDVIVVLQFVEAWGEDVPMWRPILIWLALIYQTRALLRRTHADRRG